MLLDWLSFKSESMSVYILYWADVFINSLVATMNPQSQINRYYSPPPLFCGQLQ